MSRNPALSTVTSISLLQGLKDPANRPTWQDFVGRYRPMIVGYGRKNFGLSREDAEDAAQEALNAFFEAYTKGGYDPQKGRLRKWLFGIATNQLRNFVRKKAQHREVRVEDSDSGSGFLANIPDDDTLETAWTEEWQRAIFKQCFEEVRRQLDPRTIAAYVLYVEEDRPAQEVARQLNTSPNAVYLAKFQVLRRIRELIPQMEHIW